MKLYELSLVELMDGIKNNNITVEDVVICHIWRCESVDGTLKAFESYDFEFILNEAKKIDDGFYSHDMSFRGIPIGVKDCYNTERLCTKRGSKLYENYTAGNDARIIRKIRDEGALILGKTKTSEFSVHSPSDTTNPHNIKYTPGTSSGGSAVAVASGIVPLSFGTQTAASTSKPASYCGIYGFKPTFGLFPRTGVLKTSDTLDTLSVFTRNIEDLEYTFDNLRLKGEDYPYIYNNIDITEGKKCCETFKVALILSDTFKYKPEYAKNAFKSLENELKTKDGIEVEVIGLPDFLVDSRIVHSKIYNKSISYYFKEEYKHIDAMMFGAPTASAWTLLHPEYTVVAPKPAQPPLSMAFAINSEDSAFELFMRNWIQMKKQNNDIDRLFEFWIAGKKPNFLSTKKIELN